MNDKYFDFDFTSEYNSERVWEAQEAYYDSLDKRRCAFLKNSLMSELSDRSYDDYGDWAFELNNL